MVSRAREHEDEAVPALPSASALFVWWRRRVTAAFVAVRRAGQAARPLGPVAWEFLGSPTGVTHSADPRTANRIATSGVVALACGLAIGAIVAIATHIPVVTYLQDAGWVAGWALARLVLLRVAAPDGMARDHRLLAAWGGGLLPYALAAAWPLRIAAFIASAWLTSRALEGLVSRRDARTLAAIAFGAQAIGAILAWVGRSIALVGLYLLG